MRHMNLVRHDLALKLDNSVNARKLEFMTGVRAAYDRWSFGQVLEFPGKPPMDIIETPDLFGIDALFRD